jgi:hypothetical protein
MRLPSLPAAAAVLALGACGAPEGAVRPISAAAARAPAPQLVETARFDSARAAAAPDAERLQASQAALAVRAAALRTRAAGLGSPVIGTGERARLEASVAAPPSISDPDPQPGQAVPEEGTR